MVSFWKRVGYNEESSGDDASGRIKIQTSVLTKEINIFWGESDMEVYNLHVSRGLLSRTLRGWWCFNSASSFGEE